MLLTNDPYPSGVHLNDVSLIAPVYAAGELLGYVANIAHHVDVGGGAPASIGAFREVFQEGVIIPPVKLVSGGRIVDDVFRLVLAQIRSKHETAGDFRAQVAANNDRRATDAGAGRAARPRHDRRRDGASCSTTPSVAPAASSRCSRTAPAHAEGVVDNDGYTDEPVRLEASVTIGADGVHFDTTGSDPQRRAPVNSTYAMTFSACAYALKCLIDPDLPVNDGFYRVISLDAPEGTVTNARWPAAVVGGWETHDRLVEVLFRALLPALPERLPAGTKGMMCQAGFGSLDAAAGTYTCFYETFAGGYGGRLALRRPRRRAGARPEHRERADRGDRAQLPGPDRAPRAASRTPRAPAGIAAASGSARTTSSTGRRRTRSSPTATASGRTASRAASRRAPPSTS